MLKKLITICLFVLILDLTAFSQNLETIQVRVSDQNGDLINVGAIKLIDSSGKTITEAALGKDAPGFSINIGSYTLEIQSPGFKNFVKQI
ncbi:MAG: hypothetical protein ACK5NT_16115, partial [Pyrinomonadaceae bacterium]